MSKPSSSGIGAPRSSWPGDRRRDAVGGHVLGERAGVAVGGVLQNEDAWRHRWSPDDPWNLGEARISLQEIDIPAFDSIQSRALGCRALGTRGRSRGLFDLRGGRRGAPVRRHAAGLPARLRHARHAQPRQRQRRRLPHALRRHAPSTCLFVGPGMALDPDKYFIVSPTRSATASHPRRATTRAARRGGFPHVTQYDNVILQDRMLREVFGITRLALVVGWSMGGQQAFHGLRSTLSALPAWPPSMAPRRPRRTATPSSRARRRR